MAAVPITIIGTLTGMGGQVDNVTIVGLASLTGLGVGGGPIFPVVPPGGGGGPPGQPIHPIWGPPGFNPPGSGMPPGIWGGPILPPPGGGGGPPGQPTFPIWGPPGIELPPGSGYPPVAGHPLPPPGTDPPKPIANWKAQPVWTAENGWSIVLVPTGDQPLPTPSSK